MFSGCTNLSIYGYNGSAAQAYAEENNINFVALDGEPPETTTTAIVQDICGDVNIDGTVSISDAVYILQYIANSEKYVISEQGMINADVAGNDGITAYDAFVIQQVDAGIYKAEDLPLK